ncbi:conserved oligomeric Golgi complex subunit 8 [Hyalella azteca]|uniref:Conserved oligomeric Golgi complex subunit 8 n=1 Tax=Hyalella azteca TaxID=294128 RepID=A0A8B7P7F6_HYAAZ|nr:conserved oligomeric Golgi complex subunit 8 [Hyalella azteca]
MNVCEESLLNVLMPDGVPASWLESDDFSAYIKHLASGGLQKLSSECDALKDEQASLLEQTKELAYKEYLTFIHASDCSKSLHSQLASLENQLSHTSDSVASLHSTLDGFVNTSRSLLASRQLNSTTLAKHTQLLEILELSQLLDTCVRNGYHDEALEIIAYVRRLEKRHGSIPIIKSIVREVQASSQQMLSQLLAQLRTEASLPQCLKVVGLMRTLDVFTECQLRMKFLHARDAWMTAALAALPAHDPYQHLAATVECARVHVFDVVTQYRAIFSDDDVPYGAAHRGPHDAYLPALLQSWLLHRVSGLLQAVRAELLSSDICGGPLESLLAQCLFFGQSLSRIGADFRGLLTDMFVEAGVRHLRRGVRAASHKFDEALSCYSLLDACPASLSVPVVGPEVGGRAPLELQEFPPLAQYFNCLVTMFNALRLCCLTALLPALVALLTASLHKVVRGLVELHAVESAGFSGAEHAAYARLCAAVRAVLLPYLNACVRRLYPLARLAAVSGASAPQLARRNFGQLDIDEICRPLEPFIPRTPTDVSPDTEDQIIELEKLEIAGTKDDEANTGIIISNLTEDSDLVVEATTSVDRSSHPNEVSENKTSQLSENLEWNSRNDVRESEISGESSFPVSEATSSQSKALSADATETDVLSQETVASMEETSLQGDSVHASNSGPVAAVAPGSVAAEGSVAAGAFGSVAAGAPGSVAAGAFGLISSGDAESLDVVAK